MSGDKLDVDPEKLADYAAQSSGMAAAAAAVPPLVTPPESVTSALDAVLVGLAKEIHGAVSAAEEADNAAVSKQAAALAEAAPVFVQQDQAGADDMIVASAPLKSIKYPTLHAAPPVPGQVRSV